MLKISKLSWLVFLAYMVLGIGTFILIDYFSQARDLFKQTNFLLQFNLVWFGFLITAYGLFALIQNYRRINRLGLDESLDTQFGIVLTFVFMTIYAIFDFYSYAYVDPTSQLAFTLEATGKVFFYGAFVAGISSILVPKVLKWWNN